MALKTIAFDIVAELDSEQAIEEYFRQVMAAGDSAEIMDALGVIARARRAVAQLPKPAKLH